ncbi:MAG: glycerophosphodiester phosphodiesterase family protein [Candidatus Eisenbacteria bacterium]|nr:glycerophosphodiester phosphodiesterase family protein [Candidatus Eisenbacteria bacterium]
MRKILPAVALIVLCISCVQTEGTQKHYVSFEGPAGLREYLRWHPGKTPLLGAHRGGPADGFPENCIATFERALDYAPCLIECDVRRSKDGALVLMHDDNLDRTTTGRGGISDFTLVELEELRLVDGNGVVTEYEIPTLDEALCWAKGKAVLELDVKDPVTPEEIVDIIRTRRAHDRVIVIAYGWRSAETYYRLDNELSISCSAGDVEGVEYMLRSAVPSQNLIAFVGVSEPSGDVYRLLHEQGICAILGTLGNLDRKARSRGVDVYLDLLRNGADVLATDDVEFASKALALHGANLQRQ